MLAALHYQNFLYGEVLAYTQKRRVFPDQELFALILAIANLFGSWMRFFTRTFDASRISLGCLEHCVLCDHKEPGWKVAWVRLISVTIMPITRLSSAPSESTPFDKARLL
jgi:hypothetical protein